MGREEEGGGSGATEGREANPNRESRLEPGRSESDDVEEEEGGYRLTIKKEEGAVATDVKNWKNEERLEKEKNKIWGRCKKVEVGERKTVRKTLGLSVAGKRKDVQNGKIVEKSASETERNAPA